MTYCSAAGLVDDPRALRAHADPFKGGLQGHQLTPELKKKKKKKSDSGKAQVEHRGKRSPVPDGVMTFLLLDCSAPTHNPQSVNHECTCTGLTHRCLTTGRTLHSSLA